MNWIPIIVSPLVGLALGAGAPLVLRDRGAGLTASLIVGLLGGFLGIFFFPSADHGAIGLVESALRGFAGGFAFLAATKVVKRGG